MRNTIYELKSKVEGIKSRLDKAEDRISKLEDRVEKISRQSKKRNKEAPRPPANEEGLRELQHNMKCNKIYILGIQKKKKRKKG